MPLKSRKQVLSILRQEFTHAQTQYGVSKIALFGSYAREEQTNKSDVDLLVDFQKPIGFFKFIELEDYLAEKLGSKVDLVTEDALKPMIKSSVFKDLVYV